MRKIREVLRLAQESRLSRRAIGRSLQITADTVTDYLVRASNADLAWPLPDDMDDQQLEHRLYLPAATLRTRKPQPDWAKVHRELQLPGGTLQALHGEYLLEHPDGMARAQFCALYRRWTQTLKSYLRKAHIAGEEVFVDYAGPTMPIYEVGVGEVRRAQIFVGVLGASNYTYAEAHWTQRLPDWIGAHVRMFEFFGGAPAVIVCDNLKSGVKRPSLTDPLINESYQNFAAHYRTTVIPARSKRPKDKAKVEGGVLLIERWIMFRLRNRVFTSLAELNDAIRELLVELNQRPFQKLPGCRASAFETLDKPALQGLPARPYEYVEFRRARVGLDRVITVEDRPFSVPPSMVRQEVDLRITAATVEVLHGGRRVASHGRTPGNEPVIDPSHLTPADKAYNHWTAEAEIEWAASIGVQTIEFLNQRLQDMRNRTQGYRLGQAMKKLAREFGAERLEATCGLALAASATRIESLRAMLLNRHDLQISTIKEADFDHENLRGPDYYH